MLFVPCPRCGAPVEISADRAGRAFHDTWKLTQCEECDFVFNFDDAEVQTEPDIQGAL
jgi:endogenous inhibitor of DNA gyrase (YacG/DUF329 family)